MGKRLLLIVSGSCAALAFSGAHAQFTPAQPNPASSPARTTQRSGAHYSGYPQFAYPASPLSRPSRPHAAAPRAQRQLQTNDAAASDADPYSYDGWNGRTYQAPSLDGPALNDPWSTRSPADATPEHMR
ncbi:hypothetical protein [Paraburkholderia sp.]|uniref:hypothetical protein n=1 Tax=Paraburkholderia sp. TaxID=1926495 RepID=UPI0025F20CC0|nr:hypothetical protein [Paraburkholderia sp.]